MVLLIFKILSLLIISSIIHSATDPIGIPAVDWRKNAQGLNIQGVFCFRRIVGFCINAAWRIFLDDPTEVSLLRSFELVFLCWVIFIDPSSHNLASLKSAFNMYYQYHW